MRLRLGDYVSVELTVEQAATVVIVLGQYEPKVYKDVANDRELLAAVIAKTRKKVPEPDA